MMRIADTSALYPLFDEDDDHHEEAFGALEDPSPVAVPSEILVETVNLIEYRFGWGAAKEAAGWLLDQPHVSRADPAPIEGVRQAFEAAEGELSLADAVVVQTCRMQGAEPLAFDEAVVARA